MHSLTKIMQWSNTVTCLYLELEDRNENNKKTK